MKIVVLNSSGNVGKSFISRELLYERLPNSEIIEIEGQNSSSSQFSTIKSQKFDGNTEFSTLYEILLSADEEQNQIWDIGASEIANFVENISEYNILSDIFDYFIIPTKSDPKVLEDTIKTILFLQSQNVENSKIKVIFNCVKKSVEQEFAPLLNYQFDFQFDTKLFIRDSRLIVDLTLLKTTFKNAKKEKDFYRKKILKEKDAYEKKKLIKLDLINQAAAKKIDELDYLFHQLFNINVEKKEVSQNRDNNNIDLEIDENDEEL
jgi:hypothetical protein